MALKRRPQSAIWGREVISSAADHALMEAHIIARPNILCLRCPKAATRQSKSEMLKTGMRLNA